jgi:transcriptional regulator with AAA-type ATPase domain
MLGKWLGSGGFLSKAKAGDEAPSTVAGPREPARGPWAVFVNGSGSGFRRLLPWDTLVTIGRSSECQIVVDDPRVSRCHASLVAGDTILISDLDSANGTFVKTGKLGRGDSHVLGPGDSFFLGDSAMTVGSSGLPALPPGSLLHLDQGVARMSAGRGTILMRLAAPTALERASCESIVGSILREGDWIAPVSPTVIAVGIATSESGEAPRLERNVRERLGSWGSSATVTSLFVAGRREGRGDDLLGFLEGRVHPSGVLMFDARMQLIRETLARVAVASVNVLILGETGVGKDVVASMLHALSPRADRPFVRLNCASIPESLLESELFGHERGAFTGASAAKVGLLESADGGTVFLDEIGEMSLLIQAKVLRVLESKEVTRVGGLRSRSIDVRFVAATNRDLTADTTSGRFRLDLLHRLNCVTLTVPPLRQRPSEIRPMAELFLADACTRFNVSGLSFSPAALEALASHSWPGNVRELKNVVERAVLVRSGTRLVPGDLGLGGSNDAVRTDIVSRAPPPPPSDETTLSERDRIEAALESCGGNQSRAAKALHMPRRTLVRKIARLGLPRPRSEPGSRAP